MRSKVVPKRWGGYFGQVFEDEDSEDEDPGILLPPDASTCALLTVPEDVLTEVLLKKLTPEARMMLSRTGHKLRVIVTGSRQLCASSFKLSAFCGSVARLTWAKNNGCPWSASTSERVATGGHLGALQWARSQDPPCPWDETACAAAAAGGHLEMLQWAHEHGCPWDDRTCAFAAGGGHLDMLQWARENGCPWDEFTCVFAARGRHLGVLQWARSQNPPCPWDVNTSAKAARNGDIRMLRWLREQDPPCPWDETTWGSAVSGENHRVAEWLRSNGCPPWDELGSDDSYDQPGVDSETESD
jgi:hypothetical protein